MCMGNNVEVKRTILLHGNFVVTAIHLYNLILAGEA